MAKRKVCVVVGSRANYGSIKSAMRAIDRHEALELQVVVAASGMPRASSSRTASFRPPASTC
jgi:UDP-N-acetylglucosamine 2-epimerase